MDDATEDTRDGIASVSLLEGTASEPMRETGATRVSATAAGAGIVSMSIVSIPSGIINIPSGIVSVRGTGGAPPSNPRVAGFGENAWSKPLYESNAGIADDVDVLEKAGAAKEVVVKLFADGAKLFADIVLSRDTANPTRSPPTYST